MKNNSSHYETLVDESTTELALVLEQLIGLDSSTPEGAQEIQLSLALAAITGQAIIAYSNLAVAAAIVQNAR